MRAMVQEKEKPGVAGGGCLPPHGIATTQLFRWRIQFGLTVRKTPQLVTEGAVTASAAELGRRWGWNRMRTGRRLKAWEKAGLIRRNAEAIIATTSVTSTVTDVTPTVAEAVSVTLTPETAVTRRSMLPVKLAHSS